jgi:type IV secretion system protein VirB9
MKKIQFFLCLFILIFTGLTAHAAQDSIPLSTDSRIRVIPYNPNDVFKFMGHFGYQSAIEFAADEDIKTVSIGDSTAWQVVPNGSRLFLKPIEVNPKTNMMVVTNKRAYNFELNGKETENINDPEMIFVYRFVYPGESDVSFIDKNKVPEPLVDIHPEI